MYALTHTQWLSGLCGLHSAADDTVDVAIEVEVMKCSQKKQQRQLQQPKENAHTQHEQKENFCSCCCCGYVSQS